MGDNFGVSPDPGWFNREITALKRAVEALRSERRAAATTVSDGDLVVENGGRVLVGGGGSVEVDGGILRSKFILLSTTILPAIIEHKNAAGVGGWTVQTGQILSGIAGISADIPVHLTTTTNDVRIDHTTTASAANAFLDSVTKRIYRSTSSLRYKQDVETIHIDPKRVLGMVGKTWRDRNQVAEDPETEQRHVGFIAEELHDLGLTEFVVYDTDGEPEAIAYDRLSVALLAVLKDHDARITRLENALTKES